MANPLYANYSLADFDKYNCLKLSKLFYFTLVVILRGYLVWLMSVTNMSDRVGVLQWVYPQVELFYLSLISGGLGVFLLLVFSLRRPEAKAWVKACWRHSRKLLVLALLLDFSINAVAYFLWQMQSETFLAFQGGVCVLLIIALYTNKRLAINLNEFPAKIEQ